MWARDGLYHPYKNGDMLGMVHDWVYHSGETQVGVIWEDNMGFFDMEAIYRIPLGKW